MTRREFAFAALSICPEQSDVVKNYWPEPSTWCFLLGGNWGGGQGCSDPLVHLFPDCVCNRSLTLVPGELEVVGPEDSCVASGDGKSSSDSS